MNTYLIVGLGNPGRRYEHNFHNIGFIALDFFCARFKLRLKKIECKSVTGELFLDGNKIIAAKPQTFMNLSGDAVYELTRKYKVNPENTIIVYDDIDLDRAVLRLRTGGGTGTHNGMRSIAACMDIEVLPRLRIGAGRPPEQIPLADYVLMDIPKSAHEQYIAAFNSAADILEKFVRGETLDNLMAEFNKK